MFHEDIRIISKTTFFEGATAACMLARRLQVYYSFYTPPLKLCNYVFFYYLCGVRSCHRKNLVCHPEELSILTSFPNYFNSSYIYIKTSTIEYSHCLTRLLILALQTILKKINATKFIITISIYFTTHISCYVTLSLISFTVGSLSRHDNNRFNLFYE